MQKSEPLYVISVYLKGDNLDPDSITGELGVEPTRSHRKGSKKILSTGKEVTKSTGLWSLSIERPEMAEALGELAARMSKNGAQLASLPGVEECYLDVFVSEPAQDYGGGESQFYWDTKSVADAASLGVPVQFTVALTKP